MEAYRITLDDGVAIVLQGAHALMDGASFYRLVKDWSALICGKQVEPLINNQGLIPNPDALTREQCLNRVQELGWCKIQFKSLFKMIFNTVLMSRIKECVTIEISQEELSRMRSESGASTNAVSTGMPLRAQQSMLPDMIKFWQYEPGGPVQIIFSGFAARTLSQAR